MARRIDARSKMDALQSVEESASLKSITVNKKEKLFTKENSVLAFSSWENTTNKPFEPSTEYHSEDTGNMLASSKIEQQNANPQCALQLQIKRENMK